MTIGFKKILFATDLSQNSNHALKHAVQLAKVTGADLNILHVVEALSNDAIVTLQMFVQEDDQRKAALKKRTDAVKQQLKTNQKEFWASLSDEDRAVQKQITSIEVIEGYPAEAILRRASALECDLIVLGSHDHGISHTFLGTVAKRVLRRAKMPTLVVPYIED